MKRMLFLSVLGSALIGSPIWSVAREVVVLPGVVGAVGVASGVDTQGTGTLTVGNQNINTSNDAGGGITTAAANTANIVFNASSTVTGFVGQTGATFLNIAAGANATTVTFNGPVFSTTFSLSGAGTVNFNGGFTSNSGSTMDFAGDGFINVGAGQTVKAAITNSAGAHTGTLTLNGNSVLNGAVGAASGLKQVIVAGGNALITGQVNSAAYTLGTNTLNVGGAFAIPVAGVINTTIFSQTLYGKIVPVGAASIGNALQVNVTVTGPIANGSSFNIVDATSGTDGSTVTATDNSARYLFSASPTVGGLVRITTTQIPLADLVTPIVAGGLGVNPALPIVIAPVIDLLPLNSQTSRLLNAIAVLPTAAAIADALAQLGPSAANLLSPQISYRITQRFQDLWASHLQTCGQDTEPDDRNRVRLEDDSTCQPNDRRAHVWASALGYFDKQASVNGFEGYDSKTLGAMLAYDAPLDETTRAGAGIRYARSIIDGKSSRDKSHIDSYQAMAYLGHAEGDWYINASFAYGWDNYSGTRHVLFPGFDETASADYSGHQLTAYATTGYRFYVGDGQTIITPIATLQYTRLHAGAYSETGGNGIDLSVNGQDYDFAEVSVGGRISRNIALSGTGILRPQFHANLLHEVGNQTMSNTAAFTSGGPAFTTIGLKPQRNLYDVGAGLAFAGNGTWSIEGVYDYLWKGGNYSAHQVMINFLLRV